MRFSRPILALVALSIFLPACDVLEEIEEEEWVDEVDVSDAAFVDVTRCMTANDKLSTLYKVLADASEGGQDEQSLRDYEVKYKQESEEFSALLDQMRERRTLTNSGLSNIAATVTREIEAIEQQEDIQEIGQGLARITDECTENYITVKDDASS